MRRVLVGVLAGLTIVSWADAAPDEAASAAYTAGDYELAAESALKVSSAENFALASRAINALAYFETDKKAVRRHAEAALAYAESAIKADPTLPEGHLQAAIALGLRGARMAPAKAFLINLPNRVRNYLDAALKLDPDNQWALSTSAAWRLEVARRGGGKAYNAVPEQGFAEFETARDIAPANIVIAYECALRLLASKRAEWRTMGLEALADALESKPQTAFERAIQARARDFRTAIDAGPAAEAAFIASQP